MKKIILCEGSTDTAFLGYYMSKVFGWKYVSVNDKDLTSVGITNRKNNESMKWYKKENDFLAICGVGGKDNFNKFFEVQLKEMITLTGDFDKIAVVTDRDDKSIKSIEEALDLTYENMDIRFRENVPDAEIWDLYDENRELLGKDHVRGEQLPIDGYHLVVHVWIRNSKGEYLISQCSANRPTFPLMWECVGGSVVKGEDSVQGAIREQNL